MRLLIVLVMVSVAPGVLGQQIKNVLVEQTYDDQVVVKYDLVDASSSSRYYVELKVLTHDLSPHLTPETKNLRGDVGGDIKPGADHTITWDALNGTTALVGRYVFKVVATLKMGESGQTATTDDYRSQPTDDDFKQTEPVARPPIKQPRTGTFGRTKDYLDGGITHLSYQVHTFDNAVFEQNEASGLIGSRFGIGGGITGVHLPLLVKFSAFLHSYNVKSPRLVDGTILYYGGDIGLSVCMAPFSKFLVPSIGAGYRLAVLSGDTYDANDNSNYSQVDVSTLFYEAGLFVCIPFGKGTLPANKVVIGAELKRSLGEEQHKWQQLNFFVGVDTRIFDD